MCPGRYSKLRLKRLEIHGFKSFADRTVVEFGDGLTAVVGPNGSGKSNLVDAIRWVLGEQNPRVLRAQRMEDLVFSGSATRKAVSLCEVTAVIDNEDKGLPVDFAEVSITRRMTRDGQSEYFINRASCRLKDVVDLFSDTGVGREAYSIIGQGKIDEILSAKPEDRRGLFEEAAGIVRFRNRKREALRKLEETEEGQVRLRDIIEEVESQIGPLTEQAAKALQHKDMESRLATLEIGREVYIANELSEALAKKRFESDQLNSRAARERLRMADTEAESQEVSEHLQQVELELQKAAETFAETEAALQRAASARAVAEEKLSGLRVAHDKALSGMDVAQARLSSLSDSLSNQHASISALELAAQNSSAQASLAQEGVTQVESEWRRAYDALEVTRQAALSQRAFVLEHQNEAARHAQLASQVVSETERLSDERVQVAERVSSLETERESIRVGIARSRSALSLQNEEFSKAKTRLDDAVDRERKAAQAVEDARKSFAQASGRLSALHDMKARFDGFAEGPRQVLLMARQGKLSGILGPVAELLKVESGYERAVDAALGGASQFIVTSTAEDAERAIEFLKASRGGRATFLPLDSIRTSDFAQRELDAMKQVGSALPAASAVSFDAAFKPVVQNLLGRTAIVQDMPGAVRLGRMTQMAFRIATQDGDLVNPGGSMTGGDRRDQRPGLFSREAEISRLETEVAKLEQAVALAEADHRRCRESVEAASSAKADIQDRMREIDSGIQAEALRLRTIEHALSAGNEQMALLSKRIEENKALEQSHLRAVNVAEEQAAASESLTRELEEELAQGVVGSQEKDSQRRVSQSRLAEAREKAATDAEALAGARRRLEEIGRQVDEANATLDSLLSERGDSLRLIQETESAIEIICEQQQAAVKARDLARQDLDSQKATKEHESSRLAALEKAIKTVSRSIDGISLRLIEVTAEETRLSTSLTGLEERLLERHEMSLAQARDSHGALDASVDQTIIELRAEIQALGPVNPNAPEDLQRARERAEFLSTQGEDLEKARTSLLEIIGEMDVKMKELFRVAFAQIRDNFRRVFKDLFSGGEADLSLTDPDNPLESGVEIWARPPGRNTQVLSLLSGGERCLVAIALLFAMQRLRPSPFCVLDEIEAPLDEANVERFCAYLSRLSQDNQYILITHQKRTMEVSDVLYGVTMQETGVSIPLSVKLAEVS